MELIISFIDWMKLGVPIASIMLVASWYTITKFVYPVNFVASMETKLQLRNMLTDLGPLGGDEKKVLVIFLFAAGAWMFRTLLDNFVPLSGLTDAGIAILAALSFFFIPSENNKTDLLTWEQANKLPLGLISLIWWRLVISSFYRLIRSRKLDWTRVNGIGKRTTNRINLGCSNFDYLSN